MRKTTVLILIATLLAGSTLAQNSQTDWSGGPGEAGPVDSWNDRFETSSDLSWRTVPGQLALSSTGISTASRHVLASGLSGAVA